MFYVSAKAQVYTITKCVVLKGDKLHYNYKACSSLCQHENHTIKPGEFKARCTESLFIEKVNAYGQELPKI